MLQTDATNAEQRVRWFTHDRLGMFIHWGIYAAAARHEWVRNHERITNEAYQRYFDHFDPDLYDPREWARMAKQAGMKYAVITAKHHDGFCLWDTALTDYKATKTPYGRDLLRPWVEAFRAEGLKVGFYYSLLDWYHPEFPIDGIHPQRDDLAFREQNKHRDMAKYREYMYGQVRELLTNYGKIDIIWFDFSYSHEDWGWSKGKGREDWQSEKLIQLVRELQPDILINNRLEMPEEADFDTPEQIQPREWVTINGRRVVWEACQTLNGSWGYHRDNQNWKTPDVLVRMLIDTVSNGGNLLLNVGPNGRGEFEPRAVASLQAIGEWMRLHSRSIYGATASEFKAPDNCRLTQRGNRLYLHIYSWPMGPLVLDGLLSKVEYAQFLHDASEVRFTGVAGQWGGAYIGGDEETLVLHVPALRPNVLIPVVELFLKE
ncbi:alpha-L-fucosidase [Thermosporothrix hazakensis]|jgi:alpha-L-fucosidase|uniref:alpha-L-fucosidase n=3 Tax=Thermosporothrix TaxID=768650 RepID=A0A326UCI4_THEHA|nr:alpha-L-fucosidase [Thermosporothrix hazakensis]BBH91539.1 alpha-L-fucosidase [Thermosporothrix sp. COM3]GCE49685.1 alpha-L-fucosidase [Thermosporothrix hazakensis]